MAGQPQPANVVMQNLVVLGFDCKPWKYCHTQSHTSNTPHCLTLLYVLSHYPNCFTQPRGSHPTPKSLTHPHTLKQRSYSHSRSKRLGCFKPWLAAGGTVPATKARNKKQPRQPLPHSVHQGMLGLGCVDATLLCHSSIAQGCSSRAKYLSVASEHSIRA